MSPLPRRRGDWRVWLPVVLFSLVLVILARRPTTVSAYSLLGPRWLDGYTVNFYLRLGGGPLSDGSPDFNSSFSQAASLWNNYLSRGVNILPHVLATTQPGQFNDGENGAFFSPDVYGQGWGSGIAATVYNQTSGIFGETDILFNSARSWDAYRGPLPAPVVSFDLRRVAIHELGHALGLDHPDQAVPPQNVVAIMNSRISDIDVMQADDIAGILWLYGSPSPTPTPTPRPTPTITPTPSITPTPTPTPFGFQTPTPTITPTPTVTPTPSPTPTPTPTPQPLTGAVLHFYTTPRYYYFGGKDTTLQGPNYPAIFYIGLLPGANLSTPQIQFPIVQFTGMPPADAVYPISTNWNLWMGHGDGSRLTVGTYSNLVAFPPPTPQVPSPDIFALGFDGINPQNYTRGTLTVRDISYTGNTLDRLAVDFHLEYNISPGVWFQNYGEFRYNSSIPMAPSRLVNVSTRLRTGTGANVAISGFIVEGTELKKFIVDALGPYISQSVPNTSRDIRLSLFDSHGALIAKVDTHNGIIVAQASYSPVWTSMSANGLIPSEWSGEPVIMATLPPGAYTAIGESLDPADGGVILMEVYDMAAGSPSQPVNLSTRGYVGTADEVMIGGFIVAGPSPHRFAVRAIGPSLANFQVPGVLADPILELHDSTGAIIAQNDNWQDTQAAEIAASGHAPTQAAESAIVITLPPGAYTAIVRGKNGATGVGLVEVFDLGPP